jgi:hypothetical protein
MENVDQSINGQRPVFNESKQSRRRHVSSPLHCRARARPMELHAWSAPIARSTSTYCARIGKRENVGRIDESGTIIGRAGRPGEIRTAARRFRCARPRFSPCEERFPSSCRS